MPSHIDRRRSPRVALCTEITTRGAQLLGTELSSEGLKALSRVPVGVGTELPMEARFFTGRETWRARGIVRRVEDIPSAPGWRSLGIEIEFAKRDAFARVTRLGIARNRLRWPVRPWATDGSRLVSRLVSEPLPAEIEAFAASWRGPRARFIWSWVQEGLELVTLSSVPGELRHAVSLAKQLGVMLNALMDDVADTTQDTTLLEALIHLLLTGEKNGGFENDEVFSRAMRLRAQFFETMQELPRFAEFEPFLSFDLRQMANAMRYAQLVNGKVERLNRSEQELYQHHNMFMLVCSTIDLMASPEIIASEVGLIRNAVLNGQVMGAIGNMLTTWQRELRQSDFSSAVFSLAVEEGVVTSSQLRPPLESSEIESIEDAVVASNVEQILLDEWETRRRRVQRLIPRVESVDLELYDLGLEMLLGLSLGAWGLT